MIGGASVGGDQPQAAPSESSVRKPRLKAPPESAAPPERRAGQSAVSTPRRNWSRSMDSKSALKLPSPKPLSPLR